MKMTYELAVNAYSNEKAEQAIRTMDKLVRRWYNVYGGKRTYSGRGAGNEYYIYVEYTADWNATGLHIFPEWDDLKRAFYRKMNKIDKQDEVEIHARPCPWKV